MEQSKIKNKRMYKIKRKRSKSNNQIRMIKENKNRFLINKKFRKNQ